jgi:hypothetical protein
MGEALSAREWRLARETHSIVTGAPARAGSFASRSTIQKIWYFLKRKKVHPFLYHAID